MKSNLLTTSAGALRRRSEADSQKGVDFSPDALRPWIRALPLANLDQATQLTLDAVRHLNEQLLPPDQRATALALFTPLVNMLVNRSSHRNRQQNSRQTVWQRPKLIDTLQQLLSEISDGYQMVLNESPQLTIAAGSTPDQRGSHHRYCSALYHAIEHLAQRLLLSYLIYAEPPTAVWSELHRLYSVAEAHGIAATPFNIGNANDGQQQRQGVIEHAYKRILLLSLANPYHLMPNEVMRAHQSLSRWAPQCRILKEARTDQLQGRFYIDLESDLPPTHRSLNQQKANHTSRRLLDIAELLPAEQYQRALDCRLALALIIRPERLTQRTAKAADITLASGIAASHHFISTVKQKDPEPAPNELNDHFNPAAVELASRNSEHHAFDATQKNSSLGGMALHHQTPRHFLPSGALIIFRHNARQTTSRWSIGSVKWSRNGRDSQIQLGIKTLADDAAAVVTRRFNTNQQERYHLALLTPDADPLNHPTTLLTAAGLYSTGETLQIHTEHQQLVVELTQQIESTWNFSHYRFRLIASQAH